jgi:hypothetical protein
MAQLDTQHEHDPIKVIDDQRIDEQGRPVAWLYHFECYTCAQPMPEVTLARLQRACR